MKVKFKRTGERRYGVYIERDTAPAMVMHPAPGDDEFLPHELLHFVAEAEWGLDGAVFGQLAAGGDAGTFWPVEPTLVGKAMRRRKLARKPKSKGRRSEVLAGLLEFAWKARHGKARLSEDWDERLAAARVGPDRMEQVVASLDDLAERWQGLRIGESLTLEWPQPERRAHGGPPRPERGTHRRRARPTS